MNSIVTGNVNEAIGALKKKKKSKPVRYKPTIKWHNIALLDALMFSYPASCIKQFKI